jgi:hypothetical protein
LIDVHNAPRRDGRSVKILFLCHRLPFPPNRGGRIRPFHMLEHLSRAHDVTLATVLRSHDDAAAAEPLRAVTRKRVLIPVGEWRSWLRAGLRVPSATPSSFAYFHSPRLARAVRRELAEAYDLVVVHCSSMAPYVVGTAAATLLDFGDMDSQKWLAYARRKPFPASLGYWWEGRRVRRAERHMARRFDLCTCATAAELAALRDIGAPRQSGWFPNGVDAEYFSPTAEPYEPAAICFLGQMDYYPNEEAMVWFCDAVLPQVRVERPGATLTIIGSNPSRAVRRLGERPGVRVTGAVPDVRPHARRAALSVAPLRLARGTQNKILESLAMGVPVVASPLAARGTDTVPGEHLLTAGEPRDFVTAIGRLLRDPGERRRLALAGRARMLTHHDWAASMRRLDTLIDACVAQRRRG